MRRGGWQRIFGGLTYSATALALLAGCRDPDLAVDIPPIRITSVDTSYGVTLDEKATPFDVAYAFLRAARDDFLAARETRHEDQKAAFHLQLRLSAANQIKKDRDKLHSRPSMPVQHTREEAVYLAARRWTPVVSHYVDDFADDRKAMLARMRPISPPPGASEAKVRLDVSRGRSRARLEITLTREQGDDGKKYWRIHQVGYTNPRPRPTATSRRAATTTTAPS